MGRGRRCAGQERSLLDIKADWFQLEKEREREKGRKEEDSTSWRKKRKRKGEKKITQRKKEKKKQSFRNDISLSFWFDSCSAVVEVVAGGTTR